MHDRTADRRRERNATNVGDSDGTQPSPKDLDLCQLHKILAPSRQYNWTRQSRFLVPGASFVRKLPTARSVPRWDVQMRCTGEPYVIQTAAALPVRCDRVRARWIASTGAIDGAAGGAGDRSRLVTPRGDTGESQRLTTEWWAKAWARVGLWSFHLLIGNTCGESVRSGSTGEGGCRIRADFYLRHFLVCTVLAEQQNTEALPTS